MSSPHSPEKLPLVCIAVTLLAISYVSRATASALSHLLLDFPHRCISLDLTVHDLLQAVEAPLDCVRDRLLLCLVHRLRLGRGVGHLALAARVEEDAVREADPDGRFCPDREGSFRVRRFEL